MNFVNNLIALSDKDKWEDALKETEHYFAHTHWYNEAMHIASARDIFLYCGEMSQAFKVVCPVSIRKKQAADVPDITTPYGFSGFAFKGKYEPFFSAWREFMGKEFACGHIALSPFQKVEKTTDEHFIGKTTYVIDLNQTEENIFRHMAHGHRYEIKKWLNQNHVISIEKSPEQITDFIKLHAQFVLDKNTAKVYHFNEASWKKLFSRPEVSLFSIKENDQLKAAAVFIAYQDIVDYFMVASSPEGRSHSRGILWHAIRHFRAQDYRWLHLGCGVRPEDDLEKFKARFGGEARPTFALKQIYNPHAYRSLCLKYDADTNDIQHYFPPYWASK